MDLGFWLCVLHLISNSCSILVLGLYIHYQNCYYTFSFYLLLTDLDLKYLYDCSYNDRLSSV
jgi:hypothetical protein